MKAVSTMYMKPSPTRRITRFVRYFTRCLRAFTKKHFKLKYRTLLLCIMLAFLLVSMLFLLPSSSRVHFPSAKALLHSLSDVDITSESALRKVLQERLENKQPDAGVNFFDLGKVLLAQRKWKNIDQGIRGTSWDNIKNDVVIAVKTGHEVAKDRLDKLRRHGWLSVGRDVPNIVFISDEDDLDNGVIGVKSYAVDIVLKYLVSEALHNDTNENDHSKNHTTTTNSTHHLTNIHLPQHWFLRQGWRGDKDKNLPAFHLLRTLYPNKKWYVLLDDDTYLFLDNFADYASAAHHKASPVYSGKAFYVTNCGGYTRNGAPVNNPSGKKALFNHGGSGIFLNALAMDAVLPHIPKCITQYSSCWAGDMQLALCLLQAHVSAFNFRNGRSYEFQFTPFCPSKALGDKRYNTRWKTQYKPITFHKLPVVEARLLSTFERQCVSNNVPVVYSALKKFLVDNKLQPAFPGKRH